MKDQEACLVKKLTSSIKERIKTIKTNKIPSKPRKNLNLNFEPVLNPKNYLSRSLDKFCEGLNVFKLVLANEGDIKVYIDETCSSIERFYSAFFPQQSKNNSDNVCKT